MYLLYIYWLLITLLSWKKVKNKMILSWIIFSFAVFSIGSSSILIIPFLLIPKDKRVLQLTAALVSALLIIVVEGYFSSVFYAKEFIIFTLLLNRLYTFEENISIKNIFDVFLIKEISGKNRSTQSIGKISLIIITIFSFDFLILDFKAFETHIILSLNFIQGLFILLVFSVKTIIPTTPILAFSRFNENSIPLFLQKIKTLFLTKKKSILLIITLCIGAFAFKTPILLVFLFLINITTKFRLVNKIIFVALLGITYNSILSPSILLSWAIHWSQLLTYANELYIFFPVSTSFIYLVLFLSLIYALSKVKSLKYIIVICILLSINKTIESTLNNFERGYTPLSLPNYIAKTGHRIQQIENNSFNWGKNQLMVFKKPISVITQKYRLQKNGSEVLIRKFNSLTRLTRKHEELPENLTEIDICKNEWESFQIVLNLNHSINQFKNIQIIESPFSPENFEIYFGEFVYCKKGGYPSVRTGWFNDPLIPLKKLNKNIWIKDEYPKLKKRGYEYNTPIWISVYCPKNTVSGRSEIKIKINFENKNEAKILSIPIHVHDITLPKKATFKTAFDWSPTWWKRYHNQKEDKVDIKSEYRFFSKFKMNGTHIYGKKAYPFIKDWEYCDSLGYNFFCTGYISNKLKNQDLLLRESDSIRNLSFNADFSVYGFDEHPINLYSKIKIQTELFRKLSPYPQILSTCNYSIPTKKLDFKFTLLPDNEEDFNHKINNKHWWYICENPLPPARNFLIDQPIIDARLIFWDAYNNNIEGFLYWSVSNWTSNHNIHYLENSPYITPTEKHINKVKNGLRWPAVNWISRSYKHKNGDGQLVYPGTNNTLWPSVRLITIRDGLEDHELMIIYQKQNAKRTNTFIPLPTNQFDLYNKRLSIIKLLNQ